MRENKARRWLFALNITVLILMWAVLLYHHANAFLMTVLFLSIILVGIGSYRRYLQSGEKLKCKMQAIIGEKRWDEFLEDENDDDELISAVRIMVSACLHDITRAHSAQILDKQVQISALQSQINPHFLYNTMESIRGQALTEGSYEIAKMAEALAAYFRYNIDQKGNIVTLLEEINNIQNYILIQEYRFHNKFSSSINVDEDDSDIYDYLLPKLTIQPIIENAIHHGLETKGEKGAVSITIKTTQKRLLITVSDDGIGMSLQVLDSVNQKLQGNHASPDGDENTNGTGIALINVNKRIKLIFGDQYGIQVYSTLHRGTDVEIVLPLVKEKTSLLEHRQ